VEVREAAPALHLLDLELDLPVPLAVILVDVRVRVVQRAAVVRYEARDAVAAKLLADDAAELEVLALLVL